MGEDSLYRLPEFLGFFILCLASGEHRLYPSSLVCFSVLVCTKGGTKIGDHTLAGEILDCIIILFFVRY